MNDIGWICLYRQVRENWIWKDPEKFRAWVDLLMEANHQDNQIPFEGRIITIKRGQKLTSLRKLADRWGWTRNRVAHFIDLLIGAGMVTANRTQHGTLLTIVNYDVYQSWQDAHRATHRATNEATKRTHIEPHMKHKQQLNNDNNVNHDNNFFSAPAQKKLPPAKSDIEAYCREKKYKFDIGEFMTYYDMRGWELSNGKKMTDWKAAVDYWHRHDRKMANEGGSNMPCFELYEEKEVRGTAPKFDGGLVAEMKRKRKEKA